ncbi:MAG TPA: redoxin domain-containing protein [Thermomicrobiaceae bacterium]|nr:redoxin domain-containing protein [Thermomicrobiaceae bacterium]
MGRSNVTETAVRVPRRGDVLLDFTAMTPGGQLARPRDFYMRRNLAVIFTHGPACLACRQLLSGLVARRAAVRAEAGEILAVIPGTRDGVARLQDELGITYPIAVDEDGSVHRRYGLTGVDGSPVAGIFIADRYGTIFESSTGGPDSGHPSIGAGDIPGWLEFIACRCS